MNKAKKIQLLKEAFIQQGHIQDKETDNEFITRVISEKVSEYRKQLITSTIKIQSLIENKTETLDITDL